MKEFCLKEKFPPSPDIQKRKHPERGCTREQGVGRVRSETQTPLCFRILPEGALCILGTGPLAYLEGGMM